MRYAMVENGTVTNILWLCPANAGDFPTAQPLGDIPAAIGDSFENGAFYRDGSPVLSPMEEARQEIALLDTALLDSTYQYVLEEIQ